MRLRMVAVCLAVFPTFSALSSGAERTKVDEMIAALESGDDASAERALVELPQVVPSNARAQEAVVGYVREQEKRNRTLALPWNARSLSCFDAPFALRAAAELKRAQTEEGKMLWLLTVGYMRKKAPQASLGLEDLLRDPCNKDVAGAIRMVLVVFGHNTKEHVPWLAKQFEQRTSDGDNAIEAAKFLGLGPAAKDEAVRSALTNWLKTAQKDDPNSDEDSATAAALALAISGCDDGKVFGRVKDLFERTKKDDDAGAVAMVYAYALSLMDKDHARDYWRFVLAKLGRSEAGRTGTAALLYCVPSLSASARSLITELEDDSDLDVKRGAKDAAEIINQLVPRGTGTDDTQRQLRIESPNHPGKKVDQY